MESIFSSAADRIAFSEAVDFIEQGRGALIPRDKVDLYVGKGLLERDGDTLRITDEGRRQHEIALGERFADG